MSIQFSRISTMTNTRMAIFLVGGIPKEQTDLDGWTAFQDFAKDLPADTVVTVKVESFTYGDGEPCAATPEEVAYLYQRIAMRQDFIEARANKTGESEIILWLNK